jgi:hypothetical protein
MGLPSNRIEDLPFPVRVARGVAEFALDMAVLGHTDAADTSGRIGPRDTQNYFGIDTRGDSYYFEGHLYPGGTIPDPTTPATLSVAPNAPARLNNEVVWDFTRARPIGLLAGRGWVTINGAREPYRDARGTVVEPPRREPHLLSTQTFFLGLFAPDLLTPPTLVVAGLENGNDPDREAVTRAVTGGTGPFRFARGEVRQQRIGRNTTALRTFSSYANVFAPNYRFHFRLTL